MIKALEGLGFQGLQRVAFLDSRIPEIASVEIRDDLIVEGVKPPFEVQTQQHSSGANSHSETRTAGPQEVRQ